MVGLAILGVLLLPAISSGNGLHEASVSSVALVPGLPAESASIRSCTSFSAMEPCSLKNADIPATALRVQTDETIASTEPESFEAPDPMPTAEPLPTMEVRPGDTLLAIAGWFGLTPFDIAFANGMPVDDYLQIGQVLAIPVPASEFSLPPDPNAFVAAADESADEEPAPAAVPEPQPTPEPTPAPTARPYVPPPSADEIVAIICSLPWPCEQMVRIAACESGLNPRSMNPAGYYGLFQLSNQIDNWDDALTNATFAYNYKYLPALARGGDGLSPWPVCRYY